MFDLRQSGPTGGDETAMYSVQFERGKPMPTIGEFIKDLIANHSGDWGGVQIREDKNRTLGIAHLGYSYGKITADSIPDEIKAKQIKRISASGGWSRMDYLIFV